MLASPSDACTVPYSLYSIILPCVLFPLSLTMKLWQSIIGYYYDMHIIAYMCFYDTHFIYEEN